MEKETKQSEREEWSLEEKLFLLKTAELENCPLFGYWAAGNGASLQTFRDNLSVPSLTFQDETERFVPKCRQGSTTTRCAVAQRSAVLSLSPVRLCIS